MANCIVFDIILGVVGTNDWMSTLKSVLPARKGGVFKDKEQPEVSSGSGGSEEEDASDNGSDSESLAGYSEEEAEGASSTVFH